MDNYRHIILKFDRAKQPVYNESRGKKYVEWGNDNNYPRYLLDLYNESPKHSAIVKGKCIYITGNGFENPGQANAKETWNDILRKMTRDFEIYSGFALQVIWNRAGQISDIYHLDFHKIRSSKDGLKFYVKNDWMALGEKMREYDAFNPENPIGSQIFYYKEYNPFSEVYPLPTYFAALNYINSDIMVSRHILGNANQGFTGSKLINLNNGRPLNEENKGEIERDLLKKFTGDDGKRVVIMFNSSKDNAAEIVDLGNTMLTKEDFTNINTLIQQEIFAGHQITSPVLFGVSTPGALGQRNELRDSFEIFTKTYANERQQILESVITNLRKLKGENEEFSIVPVEPLNFQFSEAIISQNLTQDEIRSIMGKEPIDKSVNANANVVNDNLNALSPLVATKVLESMTEDEIRALAGLKPKNVQSGVQNTENPTGQNLSNEAIRNLTGRQYQNVMRIVRNFGNGKLTKVQAALMLKSGYGFTDNDVNMFLGIDEDPMTDDEIQKFNSQEDDRMYNEFASCGEMMSAYEVVNSIPMAFAELPKLYQLDSDVLKLLGSDKRITAEGIAKILDKPLQDVKECLANLIKRDIIKINSLKVGADMIYETEILKPLSELDSKPPNEEAKVFMIRYTYEFRISDADPATSRPFCKKMMDLSANSKTGKDGKMWSMMDIQNMSMRLGYSVLDRCGGFWNNNGKIEYQCRHEWVANIVTKRK